MHAAAEDPDQVAGQVLQRGERTACSRRTTSRARSRPTAAGRAPRRAGRRSPSGRYQSRTVSQIAARSSASVEQAEVDPAADDAVLEVVHRVGHVVGEVHHLRLDAAARPVDALAQPGEDRRGRRRRRRTCRRRRRSCAGRLHGYFVQASSVARVRLSPTERPSASTDFASSRVRMRSVWALPSKPPHSAAELVERHLAVVAEGRVADVVGERGGLGEVGVAAERVREVAGDLGDLEAVREPVAHEVVGLRPEHLGLGRQPAQRGGVHDPGPVALERRCAPAPRPAWPARRRGARGRPRRTARPRSRPRRYCSAGGGPGPAQKPSLRSWRGSRCQSLAILTCRSR